MPAVLDAISELIDIAENTEFEIPVNVLVQQLKKFWRTPIQKVIPLF